MHKGKNSLALIQRNKNVPRFSLPEIPVPEFPVPLPVPVPKKNARYLVPYKFLVTVQLNP